MEDPVEEEEFLDVSPLLFAVNAINDEQHRSIVFDQFLEAAVASSRLDQAERNKRTISLFRPDDEDYSSDEDDGLQDFLSTGAISTKSTAFSYLSSRRSSNHSNDAVTEHDTSYVKSMDTSGKNNFFQRARIVSVSERYGLPPSKDPEGTQNLAHELSVAQKRRLADRVEHITLAFQRYPITGIVPSGWLERHRHALPSVIIVVCTISTSQSQQSEQDRRLFAVVEHLQYSLVPKRQCSVQVVGIMTDGVSDAQGQDWSQAIYQDIMLEQETSNTPIAITLLRASSDLHTASPNSPALQKLHKSMQDASLMYYLRQARRTKEKLLKLVDDKKRKGPVPIQLSALIIRYCYKIAIFYEFQLKREKCVRFLIIAYRQTSKYYKWLLDHQDASETAENNLPRAASPLTNGASGDSVEIELSQEQGFAWSEVASPLPVDVIHQCRAVADWLNRKLLFSGFSSQTEGGLVAAANQWRYHTRLFGNFSGRLKVEQWWEWLYIVRQRSTMSHLVERFPPKALSGGEYEEVMLRCSAWRAYESTAEAMLHLNRALMKAKIDDADVQQAQPSDSLRTRAMHFISKAISIFEREQERLRLGFYAEDEFSERHSCRTGARLYYLAGGILLGMENHEESANHLSKASRYAAGWRELELSIRRMLISCYEKHIPTEDDTSNQNLASMILDSYFNAEMSSQDLRKALSHFAAITGGDTLQWHHEAKDEEDESLPISFSVNFPGRTHATSGDTVVAAVTIKSNLDYAIHLSSAKLKTLAGEIEIPTHDLVTAKNADEGTDGIIVQAKSCIIVSTKIELPRDVSMIAFDESGNGGELLGTAGKGSFAKNAKPRTAGVTAAGGARLVVENKLQVGNTKSQGWNLQCLGGKPLVCEGMKLCFYPVQAQKSTGSAERLTVIELVVDKKKSRTAANIRRTPFEEENYLSSAWSRPQHVSFALGPRSIRVLGPEPGLVITDLSSNVTMGNALDGTVNRILLQLQADRGETCENLEISASCFSVLITPTGATKRLVSEDEIMSPETENSLNMSDARCRTPILVEESTSSKSSQHHANGFDLPSGWSTSGSGQKKTSTISNLAPSQTTLYSMDFYRPSVKHITDSSASSEFSDARLGDVSVCKTDYYLTIKYRQLRHRDKKAPLKRTRRRPSRRRPVMPSRGSSDNHESPLIEKASSNQEVPDSDEYEDVSLEYSGSICWVNPLIAKFDRGPQLTPSGINDSRQANPFIVIDGSCLSIRCTLSHDPAIENLKTEIVSVAFQGNEEGPFFVLADKDRSSIIYEANHSDPSRILNGGSSIRTSYSVLVLLKHHVDLKSAVFPAGNLSVSWRPVPLAATFADKVNVPHGPLVLQEPSQSIFDGPSCLIERSYFEICPPAINPAPKVGEPFTVTCGVTNMSDQHQRLEVSVALDKLLSDVIVSGMGYWSFSISPGARDLICFTLVAFRAGYMQLPKLQIFAPRFDAFVFDSDQIDFKVFISP